MFTALIDSRRLLGPNLYSRRPGAVLEVAVDPTQAHAVAARWTECARLVMDALGWRTEDVIVRHWPAGLGLFVSAPIDALLAATEVTEQALVLAETLPDPLPSPIRVSDDLLARLRVHVQHEANPRFLSIAEAAALRERVLAYDDDDLGVGSGRGAVTWPWASLPVAIDWTAVSDVPIALVTGSNGKTTTTRLLAAILQQAGYTVGYSCTDGVVIDGAVVAEGDYAGPAGARRVLWNTRVTAAVLETARGGMLRRGLAMTQADVAVVTRIAADHLGEYGVADELDLAQAKLIVARALRPGAPVVLNADDNTLVAISRRIDVPIHWFSLEADNAVVHAHLQTGGAATFVENGMITTIRPDEGMALIAVNEIPITLGGIARHNIANALAAVAAATALGVRENPIRGALSKFGTSPLDNPGRLQVRTINGVTVIVDFVHNPDGWMAILGMIEHLRTGRLIVTLGQAGDRDDVALHDLAAAVWAGRPDVIVLKEMEEYLRGRPYGQVSDVLASALADAGAPSDRLRTAASEVEASRVALTEARPGDLVVIAAHSHYGDVIAMLEAATQG